MTDKTDDLADSAESGLKVEDLSAPEHELSSAEMEQVRGGDYVQGVYRDLLGRQPVEGNINSVAGVSDGGSTGGDRSDTSRGDAVSDVYNDFLNRPKP